MYAIGVFVDTNEPDYLPVNWLSGDYDCNNLKSLVGKDVQCYWPQYRKISSLAKARKCCSAVETGWLLYTLRFLGTAGFMFMYFYYMYKLLWFRYFFT